MQTDCIPDLFGFVAVEGRPVVAAFDGGSITSDAGALLLGATDRAIGLIDRFAACFRDFRCPELIEHEVETLIGQRVFGLAAGYEDLIDHDQLRHDPVMAILAGKLKARREDCAPVAGKSTLNRLELSRPEPTRYHKISHDGAMIETLLIDLFLEAHRRPPKQIILDIDATDDPLHGHQEGRFFHGYYDGYCYLPLYVFCGRHLLAAKLRKADIDASAGAVEEIARIVARIRASWPQRAHPAARQFGFCPRGLDGLVRGQRRRLSVRPGAQSSSCCDDRERACRGQERSRGERKAGAPLQGVRVVDARELVARAPRRRQGGVDAGRGQPALHRHFAQPEEAGARRLYEKIYCARGDMENRIKECQLDLFADRTSAATMRANQLRLWFASFAYVLLCALRRIALKPTQFAKANCATIRLKLIKIGALVRVSVRRIKLAMASAFPNQREYRIAHARLAAAAR